MIFSKDKEAELDRQLASIFDAPQETIAAERKKAKIATKKRASRVRTVKHVSSRARCVRERILSPEEAEREREKHRVGAWARGTIYMQYYQGLRAYAAGGVHKTGKRAGKRKNRKEEDVEQIASKRWFRATYPDYARCLHASAGGVFATPRAKMKMSEMGYEAGTPDFFLAIPAHGKPGAFIEMKKDRPGKWRLLEEQETMIALLRSMGFEVRVTQGFREFHEFAEWWMDGRGTQPCYPRHPAQPTKEA